MNNTNKSYTMQIVDTMMNSMIQGKLDRGYNRLKNGLFEDCAGQVFSVSLEQKMELDGECEVHTVSLKFVAVNIVGGAI